MSQHLAHYTRLQALEKEGLPGFGQDDPRACNNGDTEHYKELNSYAHISSPGPHPTTPKLNLPNSGRKRLRTPGLSRSTITPSHSVQMLNIFHDAAASMQECQTPSRHMSSNMKRSRIPLSQARSVQFGSVSHQGTQETLQIDSPSSSLLSPSPAPLRALTPPNVPTGLRFPTPPVYQLSPSNRHDRTMSRRDPISSGSTTPLQPVNNAISSAENVSYPTLFSSRNCSPFSFSDEETHSTHGVPLIIPFSNPPRPTVQRPNITAWLDNVDEPSSTPITNSTSENRKTRKIITTKAEPLFERYRPSLSPSKAEKRSPSHTSSNKENRSPSTSWFASALSKPRVLLSDPSLYTGERLPPVTRVTNAGAASTFHSPSLTPRVSKRSKTHSEASGIDNKEPQNDGTEFKILDEDLVKLSPGVERFRKGKREKRERCRSYWDEDILGGEERDKDELDEDVVVREVRSGRCVLVEREDVEEEKRMEAEFEFSL